MLPEDFFGLIIVQQLFLSIRLPILMVNSHSGRIFSIKVNIGFSSEHLNVVTAYLKVSSNKLIVVPFDIHIMRKLVVSIAYDIILSSNNNVAYSWYVVATHIPKQQETTNLFHMEKTIFYWL